MEIYGCGPLEYQLVFIEVNGEVEGVIGEWQENDGTHVILGVEGLEEPAEGGKGCREEDINVEADNNGLEHFCEFIALRSSLKE
jgi:hypothetical protein